MWLNQIGDKLIEAQKRVVQCHSGLVSFVSSVDREGLQDGIMHTLCDPESFTRASNNFFKKLNTIQKAIRNGHWQLPLVIDNAKKRTNDHCLSELKYQWRDFNGEYKQLKRMIESIREKGDNKVIENIERQILDCHSRMKALEEKIQRHLHHCA